jgi:hypothetical protein
LGYHNVFGNVFPDYGKGFCHVFEILAYDGMN